MNWPVVYVITSFLGQMNAMMSQAGNVEMLYDLFASIYMLWKKKVQKNILAGSLQCNPFALSVPASQSIIALPKS